MTMVLRGSFLRLARSVHRATKAHRCYSQQAPRITTHYSIVPRETDERWAGEYLTLIFSENLTVAYMINIE
ncbi:hypothetical protein SK128_004409 [Halocaridina rubra]|uniref:Uncharacterized protein n=1 Tax=Halocaridina rubra TaxID=373956 RepID=A0AAN8WNT4_HALRR